jgi:CRISPR-associated protein Csm2
MAQTHIPPLGRPREPFGGGSRPPQPPANSFSEVAFGLKIDSTLYSDIAEAAATRVAGEPRNPRNKPSQLRRFYDELVALTDKVGSDAQEFEKQRPFIQMLKAKVAYAKGRDKVDDNFRALLCRVVDQAVNVDTLRQARLFMEAFMAYYKVYRPSEA